MNKLISLVILLHVFCICQAQINGVVFHDENGNGIKDKGESGIAQVKVSDGFHVSETNTDGSFLLEGWEKQRFVTIYPSASISCQTRYLPISGEQKDYMFPATLKDKKGRVSFVQISDTETYEYRDWVDQLKQYTKVHQPDFIVHTGDICYKAGLDWHAKNLTAKQMGVPVYYCLGNHDLIEGDYGEQFFEECFGPAWYAFEEGNSLYVITPMMGGDYQPGFSREDIGGWFKNLLAAYDRDTPKIFFNHSLLTNDSEFLFRISDENSINFNEYSLKAWVFGHSHMNRAKEHGDSKIMSYGTSTLAKGGIDHSPSGFRVVHVDESGRTNSYFRWTYLHREMEIVSPHKNLAEVSAEGEVDISVNAYHTGAIIDSIKFAVWGEGGFNWNSALEFDRWKHMVKSSDWNWRSAFKPGEDEKYELVVYAYLRDGGILQAKKGFTLSEKNKLKVNGMWGNLGGNEEHHPVVKLKHSLPYSLEWTSNIGSNIFMSSPVIYGNRVATSGFDDGNAENCFIVCFDASTGEEAWRIKTLNGVKNQMVIAKGLLIATDMQGISYAIDMDSGILKWKQDLNLNRDAFVSGIVSDGETVYTGIGSGLSALDVESGEILWKNKSWSRESGTTPTMTLAGNILVVSSHWDAIYGHDANSGELLWTKRDQSLRFRDGVLAYKDASLWVAERIASDDGMLYQLNPDSGETQNSFHTDMQNTGTSAPIVLDSTIIIAGSHPGIAAFDRESGNKIWQFEVGAPLLYTPSYFADKQQSIESTPVLIGNKIVFGAMDGCVYVLDVETGRLLWKTKLGAPVITSVAVAESCFYICDFAGNIYCFRENQ